MANLRDIAPRLSRAQYERRWEVVPEGGEGVPGTQWATLLNVSHKTVMCGRCGGTRTVMNATQRIDAGINRGTHMPLSTAECEGCGVTESSNYRRLG